MKSNKGVSLIVLIITIIVMIILASVIIISLNNTNIIDSADKTVKLTNLNTVRELAKIYWSEAYSRGATTQNKLEKAVLDGLKKQQIDTSDFDIVVTEEGIDVEIIPTVNELKEEKEFLYYSSLGGAVNAVNNGKNEADVLDEADAVAAVYTENGNNYVVLLKDTTEAKRITISTDMTINFGGHIVNFINTTVGFDTIANNGDTIIFDGKLKGSNINVVGNGANHALGVQIRAGNTAYIYGLDIQSTSNGTGDCYGVNIKQGTTITISNCNIIVHNKEGRVTQAVTNDTGNCTISNCNIFAASQIGITYGVVNSTGILSISNSEIRSYNNFIDDENVSCVSNAFGNSGTLTINDCYARGTNKCVYSQGPVYINGGIYESYWSGGIILYSPNVIASIKNATLRECDMPEGYTTNIQSKKTAIFIGGNANATNINVYINNCNIYGSENPILFLGFLGEKNNNLYISNSNINLDSNGGIKLVTTDNKLYIGKGCNFTADDTTLPESVILTTEEYIR